MKAELTIKDVPWGQLRPNPENVNRMSDAQMKALRAEIQERGFMQPVLVRSVPPDSANPQIHYEIIDGEHRWRLLGELGHETVPCVVDDIGETDANVRMLTMNRLRGNFVPIRLAGVLADLHDTIPASELRSRLALEPSELDDYLDLAGYLDTEPPEKPEREGDTEPKPGVEVVVVATQTQAERINDLLEVRTNGDRDKDAAVIARCARENDPSGE